MGIKGKRTTATMIRMSTIIERRSWRNKYIIVAIRPPTDGWKIYW